MGGSERARNEDDRGTTDPGYEAYQSTRYIQDKLACEALIEGYPGRWAVLYLSTVHGPGMPDATIRELRASVGLPVALCPPGGTSFLDLRDFLDAITMLIQRRGLGRYVVSGGSVPYAGLYSSAARTLGRRVKAVTMPRWTGGAVVSAARLLGSGVQPAVIESAYGFKYYSAARIGRELGWRPRHTLEEALESALL